MSKLGHCRDGFHSYCGRVQQDAGDGTQVYCQCRCHFREPDEGEYDTWAEAEGRA